MGSDGRRGDPPVGRPARASSTSRSVRRAGVVRKNAPEAPERVSSVQGNPMGAADLLGDPPVPDRTDPETPARTPPSRGVRGKERARGIAATPVAAAERDEGLRRGAPRDLRPDVGRRRGESARALSDPASRCVPPPVPQSWGSGNPAAMDRDAGLRRKRRSEAARCSKTISERRWKETHGRQRPSRGREAMRGGNRRGGENPRGRNVPGRQPPGTADPLAHVVEGTENPRRGWARP